jgi:hypothetical protein
LGVVALGIVAAACAPKAPLLPSGTGTPFPEFAAAYQEATAFCRDLTTITVSLGLSGKAGSTKLRGRIDAGFAAPAKLRLEGIPPFGKPVFVLVADGARGTLVLTRDDRVLQDAPPERIVEALTGVALGPDDLRTIVGGCGFADGTPSSGSAIHASANDWVVLTFAGSTGYLVRRQNAWHLAAASRGPLTINYANYEAGRPQAIDIRSSAGGRLTTDIHLRLSDVETNKSLDPRTFVVDLPDRPIPMSLDELRRAGPLGGS